VLWLGAVGTGFAYLVFFRLLTGWGPTRASLVAYLLPVVAVILGVVVLGETVDAFFLAGAVLIVAGVWVVNRRGYRRGPRAAATSAGVSPLRPGSRRPQRSP
jgi:drug/metabolite transporter (DMT)-like permease